MLYELEFVLAGLEPFSSNQRSYLSQYTASAVTHAAPVTPAAAAAADEGGDIAAERRLARGRASASQCSCVFMDYVKQLEELAYTCGCCGGR